MAPYWRRRYVKAQAESGHLLDQNTFLCDIDIHDQISVLVELRVCKHPVYLFLGLSFGKGVTTAFRVDHGCSVGARSL